MYAKYHRSTNMIVGLAEVCPIISGGGGGLYGAWEEINTNIL